jgi:hypothetical protein
MASPFYYNPSLDNILVQDPNVLGEFVKGVFGYYGNDLQEDETIPMSRVAIFDVDFHCRPSRRHFLFERDWTPLFIGQKVARDSRIQSLTF